MTDPYRKNARGETAERHSSGAPELERGPRRRLRARLFPDGSTYVHVGVIRSVLSAVVFSSLGLFATVIGAITAVSSREPGGPPSAVAALLLLGGLFALRHVWVGFAGGERLAFSRVGVAWRRRMFLWPEKRSALLSDVSTVVSSGEGEDARLELQLGRRRVRLAEGLDLDEKALRWLAAVIRRAIDRARR